MTDEEIIEVLSHEIGEAVGDDQDSDSIACTAYAIARKEIERRVVEKLMEPSMEAKLAGANAVNAHMRGPGAPADYDAATDTWQIMLRASPLYERVHGSEKGEG